MQYSDTSTKSGLLQEVESLVFGNEYGTITNNTTMLQTFTRYANQGLDHVVTKILESDSRWQYDDTTYTDFPIAIGDLVSNQQDYQLSVTHLKLLGVSIKDSAGNWKKLMPIDPQDWPSLDREEFANDPSIPMYYDVMANSLFLYPAPASAQVTLSGGLKVYMQRPPNYFATSDTTKVPGFPSLFHRLVALWAAFFYCQANSIQKISLLSDEISKMEKELQDYYSRRMVEQKPRFSPGIVFSN